MLKSAWFLITQDLTHMLRRRETLVWTFVMPIIFFYFIGSIAGGYSHIGEPDPVSVVVSPDAGFLAAEFVKRLEQQNFRVIHDDHYFRQLRIPSNFTAQILAGHPAKIEFVRYGSGINSDNDQLRINHVIYSMLGDVARIGANVTPEAFEEVAKKPRSISVDVTSAGKSKTPPIGFQQSVPGIMVMFTLQILFTVGGVTLNVERRQGILRRLASSPMSRGAVVLGKWGARVALGFLQIGFAMATGTLLFHVHWGDHFWAVLVLLAANASLAAILGMLLGNAGRNEGQVIGFGVVMSNIMAALGGCWWPIEITPPWAQKAALIFPTGWAMNALHRLMSFGDSPMSVLPHIVAFLIAALVAGYALSRRFRFE